MRKYCVAAAAQDEQPVSKPGTRTVIPLSGRVSCFIYFIGSPGKHSQSFFALAQTPTRMLFSFPTCKITFIIFYLEKNNISYNFHFDHLHVSLIIIKNVNVFICITMLYCYAAFRFIVSYNKTTRRTREYQQNNNIHISLR